MYRHSPFCRPTNTPESEWLREFIVRNSVMPKTEREQPLWKKNYHRSRAVQSSKHWIIIILPDIALYVTVSSYWNPRQIKRKPTNRSWEHNEGRMSCNNSIFNFHLDFPNFTFWSDFYNIFSYFGEIKSTPTLVLWKSSKFKRCHLGKWTTTILRG